jgi:hypothetical protein
VIRPIGACVNRPAGVASLIPPFQMKPPLFFALDAAERAVGKRLFRQLGIDELFSRVPRWLCAER